MWKRCVTCFDLLPATNWVGLDAQQQQQMGPLVPGLHGSGKAYTCWQFMLRVLHTTLKGQSTLLLLMLIRSTVCCCDRYHDLKRAQLHVRQAFSLIQVSFGWFTLQLSMLKGTLLQQGLNGALAVPSVLAVTSEHQIPALTLR